MGFVGHGPGGIGEPVATLLRPGSAGSNTAADHITAARLAWPNCPSTIGNAAGHWPARTSAVAPTRSSHGSPSGAGGCRIPSE
jgi:hypothetical protein